MSSSSSSRTTRFSAAGSSSLPVAWSFRGSRPASAGWGSGIVLARAWRSTSSSARGGSAAPIVIGRDHLDSGSVASPYRETEAMRDGSDAIADWPILNALLNVAAGATWVSVHHGGGVGIGNSHPRGDGRRGRRHRVRRGEARPRAHDRPGHRRDAPCGRGVRGGRSRPRAEHGLDLPSLPPPDETA